MGLAKERSGFDNNAVVVDEEHCNLAAIDRPQDHPGRGLQVAACIAGCT